MRDSQPRTIYLKDYQVPDFLIDKTDLNFDLTEEAAVVTSTLAMRRNPESVKAQSALVLHGQQLELLSIQIDGVELKPESYSLGSESLTIEQVPDSFELTCITQIKPQDNTSLEGLYKSQTMFCTQCEAEGFRKITYYLDRPDVMSVFTTSITADPDRYPVLLSNGNQVEAGQEGGRHWVRWHDPFKKPAYLFALVAGDLEYIEDNFITMSGKNVILRIFVEAKDIDKCDHAMQSLINSMRWDEDVYGREYDLEIFNIVAVDDFNMGAMENKSLNIFNTSCVLAKPDTTTDAGFQRVEAVVAHEYFHNWSGNRVTCRDWFQLSLKEGFTVYRDAEFSADMGSRTVKRVEDVSLLRTVQFAEDGGPMAHPVRPDSFMEISNFYTVTIYEKGAEVVRMIAHLLGAKMFRKGSDLYFSRHDGQAVTCDDFVKAMEDASGRDLGQFKRWYSQAGTPVVNAKASYYPETKRYVLELEQSCPETPGQRDKLPFHIPVAVSLLGKDGAMELLLEGATNDSCKSDITEVVLDLTKDREQFVFKNIKEQPTPSLLRGFSAPVKLNFEYTRDDLMFIMSHDSDGFCRWDAAQQLGVGAIKELMQAYRNNQPLVLDSRIVTAYKTILSDSKLDKAMVALMLKLPAEAYLAEIFQPVDVEAIHYARQAARHQIAEALEQEFWSIFSNQSTDSNYQPTAEQIAKRSLRNTALSYLMLLETEDVRLACVEHYDTATNMTDRLASFTCLLNSSFSGDRNRVIDDFYQRWQDESLVINQWFMVQAMSSLPMTLQQVKLLMTHEAFDIKNPNKVRALIGGFCNQNLVNFHQADGEGYRFLADQVITLNKINPQIASRLVGPLTKWQKFVSASANSMKEQLARIMAEPELSKDVFEVVSKSLQVNE